MKLACCTGQQDDESIELAFSKKKVEERKMWLASYVPGTYLDQSVDEISYSDFVNKVALSPFITLFW
jgi:DNA topoisomerase-2